MLKLIGLSLILAASGAVGAGLAGTVRRQQAQTLALIDALLRIRHELQYRLTPLPEIFAALGGSRNREIAEFFSRLAALLSSAQTCTVGYACRQALAQTRGERTGARSGVVPPAGGGKSAAKQRGSTVQDVSDAWCLYGSCSGGDPDLIWILT